MPVIPLLVMAALTAAGSAAGGIAGAAQQADNAAFSAAEAQKQRALNEKIQRMQLAEQQRQFQAGQLSSANQQLQSQYANGASQATALAADRAATRDDLRGNLARAYLQRRSMQ